MSWYKKTQKEEKAGEYHYHMFFSLSRAKQDGFLTYLDIAGNQVDVTDFILVSSLKKEMNLLRDDAVYVGVTDERHSRNIRSQNENRLKKNKPVVEGRVVEDFVYDSEKKFNIVQENQ